MVLLGTPTTPFLFELYIEPSHFISPIVRHRVIIGLDDPTTVHITLFPLLLLIRSKSTTQIIGRGNETY